MDRNCQKRQKWRTKHMDSQRRGKYVELFWFPFSFVCSLPSFYLQPPIFRQQRILALRNRTWSCSL